MQAFGPLSPSLPSFCNIVEHTTILGNNVLLVPRVFAFYILEHELLIMSMRIGRDVDDELDGWDKLFKGSSDQSGTDEDLMTMDDPDDSSAPEPS